MILLFIAKKYILKIGNINFNKKIYSKITKYYILLPLYLSNSHSKHIKTTITHLQKHIIYFFSYKFNITKLINKQWYNNLHIFFDQRLTIYML